MSHTVNIFEENGKTKVRIECGKYDDQILISTNGWQYSGANINKEAAEIMIASLEKYINLKNSQENNNE